MEPVFVTFSLDDEEPNNLTICRDFPRAVDVPEDLMATAHPFGLGGRRALCALGARGIDRSIAAAKAMRYLNR
jgi:hypothetical protein